VTRTAEQVEQAASGGGAQPGDVVVRGPTFGARLFGATQSVLTALLGIVILLYLLLATGDLFSLKLVRVLPQFSDKRKAVSIMKETETSISRYLVTIAMVNLGQGIVVGLVMYLVGMPNAALWGALAGAAEFIPYVGALTLVVILALAGLATFENVGHALLVPGAYLVVTLLQANVVTPMVLGRRLALNPVAIFIGLAFWLWIWGLPGAFIAVPLLATLKSAAITSRCSRRDRRARAGPAVLAEPAEEHLPLTRCARARQAGGGGTAPVLESVRLTLDSPSTLDAT
jgi:predicted PurR-regulated permease PerM